MNSTRKYAWVLVISLICFGACRPSDQSAQAEKKATSVEIERIKSRSYQVPVRVSGLLATTTQMKLSFKTGGIVNRLNVREGEAVKAGEVLAVLDLSEIRAQVNQAEIGLEKSIRDMNRARNLFQDSVVTLEQYQNAESAYELARSQKQIADFNLQYSSIKAPADGKILKILVETNEVIGPGYPAIVFASTENDWVVRAPLTDKDIVKLVIGDSAHVSMDAFPGMIFTAEVSELASAADPVTGTYETELKILESHRQFRTGFFSRAEIFPAGEKHSLFVPLEALVNASDHRAHVFIFTSSGDSADPSLGAVSKRMVSTGSIIGGSVVVESGLAEGEWIVTVGAKFLRADKEVRAANYPEKQKP